MQVNNNQGGAMEWDALWWDRGRPFRGLRNAGKVLNKLECLSSCSSIQLNHITKTCGRQVIMRCFELLLNSCVPMTSKNALGSIPWAEVKSVPVFFKERIAARMPWTAATHDTREKTAPINVRIHHHLINRVRDSLIILAPISSASLHVKEGVRPPEITFTRTWNVQL